MSILSDHSLYTVHISIATNNIAYLKGFLERQQYRYELQPEELNKEKSTLKNMYNKMPL